MGKSVPLDPKQGPGNQNRARIIEGENPEKAESMLEGDKAKVGRHSWDRKVD